MNLTFRGSFLRDLKSIKDEQVRTRIVDVVHQVERARTLGDIPQLKKLSARGNYYRIRVGDYRLGAVVNGDDIVFARCLHRKDIYRHFPEA